MKQILQDLKNGETQIVEVPSPSCQTGCLLIRSVNSLISAGTERMLVDFGKAGWIDKARQQPEKVKQVIQKVKTDGLAPTLQTIQTKLDQPQPLGYSNAGIVLEVGAGVEGFALGDRVLSNGRHAEVVCVPKNLCAKIPDNVPFENAAFGVVASIGLQGIRLLNPTLGEKVVVTGLGLIGLLTVQMLRANGCDVLGIDLDSKKCALAREYGASVVDLSKGEDPISAAQSFSEGRGIDGVVITAKSSSNDPIHQAAEMCRKRGRIVLVGVVGLELQRSDFYQKELTFQVSCSYGPGRYDNNYEQHGVDYPIGFVRWTEQRNFDAVLGMLAIGTLNTDDLISHRIALTDAQKAYDAVTDGSGTGIVLQYPNQSKTDLTATCISLPSPRYKGSAAVCVGIIGAGNFTGRRILPSLAKLNLSLKTIVSSQGVSGSHLGKKYGFATSSTDPEAIFTDPEINLVFITTRHDSHAQYVLKALRSEKHVFVEKPLALDHGELEEIEALARELGTRCPSITVGFNRRFSPHITKIKGLLDSSKTPKALVYTVNAGYIPANHWTQDPKVGGGRIIGEACHFIDLCRHLIGHPIVDSNVTYLAAGLSGSPEDTATISLGFEDGSVAAIHYLSNGHKGFAKERLEAFCDGKILELDNFRKIVAHGWKGIKHYKSRTQAKGHHEEIVAVVKAIGEGGDAPIPLEQILQSSRVTLDLAIQK